MGLRVEAPPLSARLLREHREWLAMVAEQNKLSVSALLNRAVWHFRNWQEKGRAILAEVLAAIDAVGRAYEKQAMRLRYAERRHRLQLRRQRNLRRAYEKQLRRERALRHAYGKQLRRERALRRACEKQLLRQRGCEEWPEAAVAEISRNTSCSLKVAKLLALAVGSDSDGEATTAFAKARMLHRPVALFPGLVLVAGSGRPLALGCGLAAGDLGDRLLQDRQGQAGQREGENATLRVRGDAVTQRPVLTGKPGPQERFAQGHRLRGREPRRRPHPLLIMPASDGTASPRRSDRCGAIARVSPSGRQ
jgi:hypothetical protein